MLFLTFVKFPAVYLLKYMEKTWLIVSCPSLSFVFERVHRKSFFPDVSDLTTLPDTLLDRLTSPKTLLGIRKGRTVEVTRDQSKLIFVFYLFFNENLTRRLLIIQIGQYLVTSSSCNGLKIWIVQLSFNVSLWTKFQNWEKCMWENTFLIPLRVQYLVSASLLRTISYSRLFDG